MVVSLVYSVYFLYPRTTAPSFGCSRVSLYSFLPSGDCRESQIVQLEAIPLIRCMCKPVPGS